MASSICDFYVQCAHTVHACSCIAVRTPQQNLNRTFTQFYKLRFKSSCFSHHISFHCFAVFSIHVQPLSYPRDRNQWQEMAFSKFDISVLSNCRSGRLSLGRKINFTVIAAIIDCNYRFCDDQFWIFFLYRLTLFSGHRNSLSFVQSCSDKKQLISEALKYRSNRRKKR